MGLTGALRKIKANSNEDVSARVKVQNQLSKPLIAKQGVKQGGITSTVDYNAYLEDLINQYENSEAGATIRNMYVGAPACADDVILLASNLPSVATLTNITYNYACRERYTIHPEKRYYQYSMHTRYRKNV